MRIRAERDDLADVLARAGRAVGTRSPLPILQGVLCEVAGGKLTVTGTDNEVTVRTYLEVEVTEEGRTVIPAKLAAEAVRKLPPGAVTLASNDGEVEITGGGPRFQLREMTVDDYPKITDKQVENGIQVDAGQLIKALGQVGVAASVDDARPTLTGVLFEGEGDSLRLVATDSYRLGVRDVEGVRIEGSKLVPYRALRELGRAIGAGPMTVSLGEREAAFVTDRGRLTVRIIDSTFPNYRQLLPEGHTNRLTVDKAAMLEAVGRAALVAEDHIPVRLAMHSGGVELSVIRQEVGEATELLEGEYVGEDMTIAFNTRYLTDGVNAVDDEKVVIETSDPLKPGLLLGSEKRDFQYLLMPVRL
ncbi:MAG: DNA polymerase III subunit beta [Actinobacteria bacterium]|nr:MAG: DNA polymerase III subunit beta [Actinomycetota bacterium]